MLDKLMKMRIQKRLKANTLFCVGLTSLGAIIAVIAMVIIINRYDRVITYYAFPQGNIGHAMSALAEVRSATRGAIGYEQPDQIATMIAAHDKYVAELEEHLSEIKATVISKEGKANYEHILEHVEEYLAIDAKVLASGTSSNPDEYTLAYELAFKELAPTYDEVSEALQELMDTNMRLGDSIHHLLEISTYIFTTLVIIVIIFVIVTSMKVGVKISKGISEPLTELSERLYTFEQGDISSPFPTYDNDDEVGDMVAAVSATTNKLQSIISDLITILNDMANGNFNTKTSCKESYIGDYEPLLLTINQMNDQISATLSDVRTSSEMVSSGSGNLAKASNSLAEGAAEQAASVEEMLATMEEITVGIENNLKEVNDAYENAKRCTDHANTSRKEMNTLMEAMSRINDTSKKIGNIITEIEDIASQTNLLSLNAAIEAARAGEAGKGFAVVAEQIRTLAEQSAKSAVNTRQLIEASIVEVNQGNVAANKTASVLTELVNIIQEIADTSAHLSETSEHQTESIQQANAGIVKISEVVQSNSSTAEEVSATSEELSAQAICLEEMVQKFQLKEL